MRKFRAPAFADQFSEPAPSKIIKKKWIAFIIGHKAGTKCCSRKKKTTGQIFKFNDWRLQEGRKEGSDQQAEPPRQKEFIMCADKLLVKISSFPFVFADF